MPFLRPALQSRFRPEQIFRPASIALTGAGTDDGALVLANLQAGGFSGRIATDDDIAALPAPPDLAIVANPPSEVPDALAALGRRGAFVAAVTTYAPEATAAARAAGVRLLGPGSFGVAVPGIGLNATLSHLTPPAGRIGLVCQSAALCRAVMDWAGPNGVGFSHVVGLGTNTDIGFGLVLDWLSRDPGTGLILLDIRRIKDRRAFLSAARACTRTRPVVAIHAGGRLRDPSGQADAVFAAALRRAGVLDVARLDDLLVAAETLTQARPARSEHPAIVSNAIGPAGLAADAALADGLTLAMPGPETASVLQLALGEMEADRPGLIHVPATEPLLLAQAAALLAGAPEVGGVVVVHAPSGPQDTAAVAALAAGVRALHVPVLVCAMGETTGAAHRRALTEAGIPAFAAPEQAVRGFWHLVRQRRARAAARELPAAAVLPLPADPGPARRAIARARAAGQLELSPESTSDVLAAYGIASLPARAAATPEDAADAATLIGFPVSLEHGGAVLRDLSDADRVRAAATALVAAAPRPGGTILVRRQSGPAIPLALLVVDDPVFGPAIGLGPAGSRLAPEFDLPPLNLSLAQALLARLGAPVLAATRDRPAANPVAVAEALVRISQLVVDMPDLARLEIEPLLADAAGVRAGAASLRLRPPGELARLAIAPYPSALEERLELGGTALVIRPIRPEDAAAHAAFFRQLTPEDVRFRFFSAMRELSAEQIARMTQVDYDREMAFIAVQQTGGGEAETVGVARLVIEQDAGATAVSGEFAVVVRSDMKGRGLASRLMRKLFAWARARRLVTITGQVLADNAPMLAFVRHLGFELHHLPADPEVVEARMQLLAEEA